MSELDTLYVQLSHLGFSILRNAIHSGDQAWMEVEVEMLHNVPTLIGEDNVERHRLYWEEERTRYINWIANNGSKEAVFHKEAIYDTIWKEMEPLVEEMFAQHDSARPAEIKH